MRGVGGGIKDKSCNKIVVVGGVGIMNVSVIGVFGDGIRNVVVLGNECLARTDCAVPKVSWYEES